MTMNINRILGQSGLFAAIVVALVSFSSLGAAQEVPAVVPYSGFLTDGGGNPVNGPVNITFRLYNSDDAGATAQWEETVSNIPVEDGVFYAYLGMTDGAVVDHINAGGPWWLGIQVGTDPEASPRQSIGSVPYAVFSKTAETAITALNVEGIDPGEIITRTELETILTERLAQVSTNPYIYGATTATTNGQVSYNGQQGLVAVHAMCDAQWADSHACTPEEVTRAVAAGEYASQDFDGQTTWMFAAYSQVRANNNHYASSLGTTCQHGTYPSGDVARGTTMTVDFDHPAGGGGNGFQGHTTELKGNVSCGQSYPVLCCR